jgi:hypothetical protein
VDQSLRGFALKTVRRDESVTQSLNAGSEETLDLMIEIEEIDTQKFGKLLSNGGLADTTDTRQKHSHLSCHLPFLYCPIVNG